MVATLDPKLAAVVLGAGAYDFFYRFNEVKAGFDGVDVHENLILREVLKQTIV